MPLEPGAPTAPPANALERGLADVWLRTITPMAPAGRRMFRAAMDAVLDSWLWEVDTQAAHRVPDPVDYLEMRRVTFGSPMTASLARMAHMDVVPEAVYESAAMQSLEAAAFDCSALMNDVYSYQKEVEYEGELLNMLVVTETFFGCDYRTALGVVNDLVTSRMKQFEHVLADEFPAMYRDFGLDAAARAALDRYADELKQWMAAIAAWHAQTRRYREEDLERHRAQRTGPVVVAAGAGALPRAPHRAGWAGGCSPASRRASTR